MLGIGVREGVIQKWPNDNHGNGSMVWWGKVMVTLRIIGIEVLG